MAEGPNVGQQHGHEQRDVDIRAILIVGAIIAGTIVLVAVIARLLVTGLAVHQAKAPAGAFIQAPTTAPTPTLQPHPTQEINAFRAEKTQVLSSYGWVDKQGGIARIPVDRAIAILAAQHKEKLQ